MSEKKLVFCGGGHMSESILKNILANDVAKSADVTVSDLLPSRCEYLTNTYGVKAVADVTEDLKQADFVLIAVLPKVVKIVAKNIRENVSPDALIMSIAAGVQMEELEEMLGADRKIVRVSPNTLNMTGNGYSAVCVNKNVGEEEKAYTAKILDSLGQTMFLSEELLDVFSAYGCAGPMWMYMMIEAMVDAGVYQGFSRPDARKLVLKNMIGSAQLLEMTGEEPRSRISEMCSPGGVTIEGYRSLLEKGFADAVMTSVDEAVKKVKACR